MKLFCQTGPTYAREHYRSLLYLDSSSNIREGISHTPSLIARSTLLFDLPQRSITSIKQTETLYAKWGCLLNLYKITGELLVEYIWFIMSYRSKYICNSVRLLIACRSISQASYIDTQYCQYLCSQWLNIFFSVLWLSLRNLLICTIRIINIRHCQEPSVKI